MYKIISIIIICTLMAGCVSASKHRADVQDNSTDKITVGTVQKEIRQGMTATSVAEVLGSPNIVSSEGPGLETWIYDKVSTDTAYSKSSGGVQVMVLGWGTGVAGGVAPGYSASSGATTRTQRTLTIIIKYVDGKVNEFSYHSSSF